MSNFNNGDASTGVAGGGMHGTPGSGAGAGGVEEYNSEGLMFHDKVYVICNK